ncbi:bifunctional DNA-formamidopyrimidine glycosylase/DNA-(apurinic or apyrimidinic site) lyase [Oceanicoccus sp. KOV_DT_Chl]|uniref:bifunctional DNA-formamidopyrimidine glycosylase/DNA-(apurinic or apyrimidinic site) lyase n=1 Tax=Oceanicoccus sp. KOV_DT_Chl TaxID=1904639 RepID=UPI000C79E663|nr:bifunctional DNA-formamidopyrimidine glycosylase/DNA-(apurinic or apyrimidinic site) lyase [Oceanicoccus sp. KOV_DT_Chl]
MPELPEVETTRLGIEPHILQRHVKKLVVRQPQLRWAVPANLARLVKGKQIQGVERRAKYLLLHFSNGTAILHLGMSGSLRIIKADEPPMAHDHVDWVLDDGHALRFTDPRRFGCLLWQGANDELHSLLASLGPEPLTDDFDGELLFQRSRGRKAPVKTFIMDNKIVVGVGNIYANEALFAAGIRPDRQAGKVSQQRYLRLAQEIKTVLAQAIEQGGTTLRDFVGGDGKPGYFKQQLKVYGRGDTPCITCKASLKEVRLGQRSTVFCPQCQR